MDYPDRSRRILYYRGNSSLAWLPRIYDAQDECLFTGVKMNSRDINVEEDVIETSISIPLLDTRDVPKIRVHKSAMKSKAWVATREGCDYPFPHVAMSRYKKGSKNSNMPCNWSDISKNKWQKNHCN